MISLINVSFAFSKQRPLFESLNIDFNSKEKIGILALPGSGKTVLSKLLSGVESPSTGYVTRKGRVSWPIGYAGLFHPELTGKENIAILADLLGEDVAEMVDWCENFGQLGSILHKKLKLYTPANRAMLAYCGSLSVPCDWYIADEKITLGRGKDLERSEQAISLRLEDSGLIFISKNTSHVKKYCDRFFAIIEANLVEFPNVEVAQKALDISQQRNSSMSPLK